jgi:hypothetical protein
MAVALKDTLGAEPHLALTSEQRRRVYARGPPAFQPASSKIGPGAKVIPVGWLAWGGWAAAACLVMLFWLNNGNHRFPDNAVSDVASTASTNLPGLSMDQRESIPPTPATLPMPIEVSRVPAPTGTEAIPSQAAMGQSLSRAKEDIAQTTADLQRPGATPNVQSPSGSSENWVPLQLQLPKLAFIGTPTDFEISEHIEPPSDKPRPLFLVPAGVQNVALLKPVILSDKNPTTGEPGLVTDGDKEATDTSYVQMHRGLQWAQVDLGGKYAIYAIVVWHAHNAPQVYHDVVVQVSNDPDFVEGVRTVHNNDYDNSSGLGVGTDKEYFENFEGRLIDAKGVTGRYVRFYSKGSTYSALNRRTEVEIYGLPENPPVSESSH